MNELHRKVTNPRQQHTHSHTELLKRMLKEIKLYIVHWQPYSRRRKKEPVSIKESFSSSSSSVFHMQARIRAA